MPENETNEHIGLVKQYIIEGEAGNPTILKIFTNDVELRFRKFGRGWAKKLWVISFKVARRNPKPDTLSRPLRVCCFRDIVVAEGWESGVIKDGTTGPTEGRFDGTCSTARIKPFHRPRTTRMSTRHVAYFFCAGIKGDMTGMRHMAISPATAMKRKQSA